MERRAKGKDQEREKDLHAPGFMPYTSDIAPHEEVFSSTKTLILLTILIASSVFFPQEARTQEIMASEISRLATRLKALEERLTFIDSEFTSLKDELERVANEKDREETKPKSFWRKLPVVSWLGKRKSGKLYARSQELSDEMSKLWEERNPRIEEFTTVANELIQKSSSRITALAEAFLRDDSTTQEEAARQVSELSELWALVARTREARDKYAPKTPPPGDEEGLPTLLSNDPEDLKQWVAIWRDEAVSERDKAAKLGEKIKDLERRKIQLEWLMEKSEDFRRKTEERDITGVGIGNTPWNNDVATEREIEIIKENMAKLETSKQEHEEKADQHQQLAEEIEAKLKGKLEDD